MQQQFWMIGIAALSWSALASLPTAAWSEPPPPPDASAIQREPAGPPRPAGPPPAEVMPQSNETAFTVPPALNRADAPFRDPALTDGLAPAREPRRSDVTRH